MILSNCIFSPGMSPENVADQDTLSQVSLTFHNLEDLDFSTLPSQTRKYEIDEENLEDLISNNEYRYLIGSGDKITLNSVDNEDLNGEYVIDSEGFLNLPYVGKVMIVNLTKNQAEDYLEEIAKEYYQEPDIILSIIEYKSRFAYITGDISKPQSFLLTENKLSLIDAILNAGYIKDQKSYDKKALLKRGDKIYFIDLYKLIDEVDTRFNIFLREDDILHIQRKNEDMVYVFGEASQGSYPLFQNSNLTKLLTNAKINQVTADFEKIYIIREDLTIPFKGDVYQLDAKNPNKLLLANKFNLLAGDVIFISPSPIVRWNRVISLITPQSGIFTTYKDINNVMTDELGLPITSGLN